VWLLWIDIDMKVLKSKCAPSLISNDGKYEEEVSRSE
jgi:hypothetical protein